MSSFLDYHFKEYINEALKEIGFKSPTNVQRKVLSKAIKGESLMVESATGSGKTHSFLLPIFQNLDEYSNEATALIVSPTRELAEQLYSVCEQIASKSKKKINIFKAIGGSNRDIDAKKLENSKPQIIIGTIGRIYDLVIDKNVLKIHQIKTVVIDEADMIFEEKEIEQIDHIMAKFVENPQFLIFSATISKGLRVFLNKYFSNIETIILEEKNLTHTNIEHLMLQCKAKQKEEILLSLLDIINPFLAIIFVNTKERVDEIANLLASKNYRIGRLHGGMEDRERKQMIKRIKNLEFQYIIASDIAARGIDIDGVSHVINVDLPNDIEFYIHRSGRTARHDKTGQTISLYAYDDDKYVKVLRDKGLIIKFVKIVNGELVQTKMEKKQTHSFVKDIETKVHQQVKMPKKIKPGYKKKRMEQIDKIIRKERRAHIEEIYKKRAREVNSK